MDKDKAKAVFAKMMAVKEHPTQEGVDVMSADIGTLNEEETAYLSVILAHDLAKRKVVIKNGFDLYAMYRLAGANPRFIEAIRSAFYYGVSHCKTAYDLALGTPEEGEDSEMSDMGLAILSGIDEEMAQWHADEKLREMPTEGQA